MAVANLVMAGAVPVEARAGEQAVALAEVQAVALVEAQAVALVEVQAVALVEAQAVALGVALVEVPAVALVGPEVLAAAIPAAMAMTKIATIFASKTRSSTSVLRDRLAAPVAEVLSAKAMHCSAR
ncbi:hypothetical protein [Comamonas sp. JUb58]|uniref:hypothetical protein n=1 Tax=Comamonas sp. JUb58 TaxID=2485114 RepID=UPI001AAE7EFC|nr:hypothetical protein [Comamonas sp. JUb58]